MGSLFFLPVVLEPTSNNNECKQSVVAKVMEIMLLRMDILYIFSDFPYNNTSVNFYR